MSFIASAQFFDDFEDGDFQDDILWTGDVDNFVIESGELRLVAPEEGSSQLLTTYAWGDSLEFGSEILLDFAPSGSNKLQVFLFDDDGNAESGEALYLEIGESGSEDAFILNRRNDLDEIEEIHRFETVNHTSNLMVRLKVEKLNQDWTFSFDHNNTGTFDEMTMLNFSFTPSLQGFFGYHCFYTSSRTDRFYFDNASVLPVVADQIPPEIFSVEVVSLTDIILTFNEAIDGSNLSAGQFSLEPGPAFIGAVSFDINFPEVVNLQLSTPLQNQSSYTLNALDITDVAGNNSNSLMIDFSVLIAVEPNFGDVIINEIHAAPSSNTLVPNAEFVELYNRLNKIINLEDLTFSDATTTVSLPDYVLLPMEHAVLVDNGDLSLFDDVENVVGLTELPSLNNGGDELRLSSGANLIDAVNYDDSWYLDSDKTSGWSLECKNTESACRGAINWIASDDPSGGTPGEINSVFTIDEPEGFPQILRLQVISANTIQILFNLEMDESELILLENYSFSPQLDISGIFTFNATIGSAVQLNLSTPLQPSQIYQMQLSPNICGCNGSKAQTTLSAEFGLPALATQGDLIISEILFEPLSGEAEFIEIYNASQNIINADELWMQLQKPSGDVDQFMIETSFQLLPNAYYVLTEDFNSVVNNYTVPFENQVQVTNLPSLVNDGGELHLFRFEGLDSVFIDRASYSPEFHDPLLHNSRGVSLEKVHLEGDGLLATSWYSAATNIGGATPTGVNSQLISMVEQGESPFSLLSPTFSPDGDGFEDVMIIGYEFEQPGFIGQVAVYSHDGAPIKMLTNNESFGISGQIRWSGDTDDGDRARVGVYYVFIEAFRPDGETIEDRIKVVLARQF